MHREIKTITLTLPYKLGSVNCYLAESDPGHILIDTGVQTSGALIGRVNRRKPCGRNRIVRK